MVNKTEEDATDSKKGMDELKKIRGRRMNSTKVAMRWKRGFERGLASSCRGLKLLLLLMVMMTMMMHSFSFHQKGSLESAVFASPFASHSSVVKSA